MKELEAEIEEFLISLKEAFSDVAYLGTHYSLMDGEFCDDNHRYPDEPEEKCTFLDGTPVGTAYSQFLNKDGLLQMKWQVENRKIINKKTHWQDITDEYLWDNGSSLSFLPAYSFSHYMAAFMNTYAELIINNQDKSSLDMVWVTCSRFFEEYPNDYKEVFLSEEKRSVIGHFLYLVAVAKTHESFDAKNILLNKWKNYAPEAYDKFLEFQENEEIQKFINQDF